MEHREAKQSEQERVSSQGESPKGVNQNTYTQEEKDLATKYKVEPRLIRMIAEIVKERLQFLTNCIEQNQSIIRSIEHKLGLEPWQAAEDAETQDQPEQEQPEELSIDQQTQERLKSLYKNLDPKTKLAILTLLELQCLDGINFQISKKEGRLYDEIWDDLQSVRIETYHTEPDDVIAVAVGAIDKEDIWLCGVWEAIRMVTQNT